MARDTRQPTIVTGLDIGSTMVRVAVGQIMFDEGLGRETIQIVASVEVPSEGLYKGNVTSIEDVVSSVANALEQAERMVGYPIENVWVGISGADIISQSNKGVVAVAKSDGEISSEDVERAVDAARAINAPLNYDVLHVLPKSFSVDGQTGIKDPIGMTGMRLEVDTQMIHGLSAHLKNITKAVYRTGVDIDDVVLSILAVGEAVVVPRQKELGVAVLNIGGANTSLIVYEEGDILHTGILPIGSSHITNDLAIGLRTSIDIAELIKKEFETSIVEKYSKKDVINLADFGSEDNEHIPRQYIAEIIEARASEIFSKVDEELLKIERNGLLPAGVIITGGGAKIPGMVSLAKDHLKLPVTIGTPVNVGGITDKINDLAFSTAIGLVKWGALLYTSGKKQKRMNIKAGKMVDGVKKVFRSLIP
ncbi:MAG: cell division protein FtsA [Candidatus Magasanikbacteria bacterium CG11_big_fil_rev_8_21_14_0_20_39_34]|uniref:Cell division protein FtsA n=1 Tax=Candidatus Magasanikbacteria bacterium CG11_big_fil_rev_8_21_14_0_20_39_34 TaxID=1974653 RepID=A0A2H0N4U1_9BACT|nr:MAG: cell division protein FtsA [Candidatus Magasanikbacteria bacterium CG11_big_fil_rev_8_21_14_0_20_39_34]